MPKLSLKTMFGLVFLAAVACYVLAKPAIDLAAILMAVVLVSLVAFLVFSFWMRRLRLILIVLLSLVYLVIADGGVVRTAERILPTEWCLERFCSGHTSLNSGRKRSDSLTQWISRLYLEPDHRDLNYVYSTRPVFDKEKVVHRSNDISEQTLDELLSLVDGPKSTSPVFQSPVNIQFPKITVTSVSTVSRRRDCPQNRAFFIMGHCLTVLLVLAVVVVWEIVRLRRTKTQASRRGKAMSPS